MLVAYAALKRRSSTVAPAVMVCACSYGCACDHDCFSPKIYCLSSRFLHLFLPGFAKTVLGSSVGLISIFCELAVLGRLTVLLVSC